VDDLRPVEDLTAVDDPAWPWLQEVFAGAAAAVTVLPVDEALGARVLHRLQVSAASALGALALHTGGVTVDHGWVRMLGGGSPGLPDLATANGFEEGRGALRRGYLLVAWDVLGGRFAINAGELPGSPGEVAYWAPDTLAWEPLEIGHSGFVQWVVSGGLERFAGDWRWPGWEAEVAALPLDHGLSTYPPVHSAQGRDVGAASRRGVPMRELHAQLDDAERQLRDLPDGAPFTLAPDDGPVQGQP
jgi:hypothetical protein